VLTTAQAWGPHGVILPWRHRRALAAVIRRAATWVFALTGSSAAAQAGGVPTEDLILRFQRGQPRAFEALYDRYKEYIYRIAFSVLRNREEAEDAVQEIFLDLLNALPAYDVHGPARFETWLYRVALNRARMRLRRKVLPSAEWDDLEEGLERLPMPDSERPERVFIVRESAAVGNRQVAALQRPQEAAARLGGAGGAKTVSQSHLGEQLLAYLDGELSPEEARRVEAHVAQCPQCAAELAELRALGQGLGQTLDAVLSRVKLSREADDRIRAVLRQRLERRERAGRLWRFWGRRMQVAQAALAIMLLAFSFGTYRVLSLPAPAAAQEVLVFGESRLAPGSQGALRVIVRTVDAAGSAPPGSAPAGSALASVISPVAGARVIITLLTESGVSAPLYEGETDHLGTVNAAFTVPEISEGSAELVIETSSTAGEERLERSVRIARSYKIYIMADKPAYRPGQTLQMRALVLDSTTLRPVSGDCHPRLKRGATCSARPLATRRRSAPCAWRTMICRHSGWL